MKKYKLIKEYPGSPKLGTINGFSSGVTLGLHFVENQLEFWEEVLEKEYQILSIFNPEGTKETLLSDEHNLRCWNDPANRGSWVINSIKRLSDNEVFTLGDDLDKSCIESFPHTPNKITSIRIVKNPNNEVVCSLSNRIDTKGLLLFSTLGNIQNLNVLLSKAKKVEIKTPLYTTEDGVDLFENTEFYYVVMHYGGWISRIANSNCKYHFSEFHKLFSTKEKAEEFIFMNEKTLSIDDILEVWSALSGNTKDSLMEKSTLMSRIVEFVKLK